jgi:hypothetical protein
VFHLLTLPFRLAFGLLVALFVLPFALLALPLLLVGAVVKVALAIVLLPLALIGAAVGVCVPILPFAVLALCVWLLTQRSPAATAGRG